MGTIMARQKKDGATIFTAVTGNNYMTIMPRRLDHTTEEMVASLAICHRRGSMPMCSFRPKSSRHCCRNTSPPDRAIRRFPPAITHPNWSGVSEGSVPAGAQVRMRDRRGSTFRMSVRREPTAEDRERGGLSAACRRSRPILQRMATWSCLVALIQNWLIDETRPLSLNGF